MTHASLRENGEIIHGLTGDDTQAILATAGLLAEAINFRNGFRDGDAGMLLSLSIFCMGFEGVVSVDEYSIRAVGMFWLLGSKTVE